MPFLRKKTKIAEEHPKPELVETEDEGEKEKRNPLQAVRAMCLSCMDDSPKSVKNCQVNDCPIHHLRLGSNPFRKKREFTEEQREALKERMKKAREARHKNEK